MRMAQCCDAQIIVAYGYAMQHIDVVHLQKDKDDGLQRRK